MNKIELVLHTLEFLTTHGDSNDEGPPAPFHQCTYLAVFELAQAPQEPELTPNHIVCL